MKIKEIKIPEQFGSLYVCPVPERSRKSEHETAHALLKSAVQKYAESRQIQVSEQNLVLDYLEYQKPYFRHYPEIYFNLSHCTGLAVCLLSGRECGVDAESVREMRPAVVRRVFSPEEQQLLSESAEPDKLFTKIWTLKESYVKAIGRGIGFPMQEVSFSFEADTVLCSRKDAEFCQISYEDYTISVCVLRSGVQP